MIKAKRVQLQAGQEHDEGKAIAGVRRLRSRLAAEVPAFAAAVDIEKDADDFCREIRAGLRDQRKKLSLDQSDVAERLDMTQSTISKIEIGDGDIGAKTIFRYARALGLRPVCVFVPTGLFDALPSNTKDAKIIPVEAAKAMEEFQVNFVREACNNFSTAMAGFARVFKE